MPDANPTGVNTFNGVSDASKAEAHFESLWQAGAFDSQKPAEAAQLQAERRAESPPDSQPSAPPPAPPADSPPPVQEPESPPATQEAEGPDYVNLEDYLQKAGIERESFLQLPARVKVDGKEEDVPIAQLIKSYGLEKHIQQKSIAFAEQQKAWEGEREQARQAFGQQLNTAKTLLNLAHQSLLEEFKGIDWNTLRMQDPAQWAVRNQEFQNKAGAIQQYLNQVQQAEAQQRETAQKEQAAKLPQEAQKMLSARPEWRDEKTFVKDRAEMTSYARSLGFTDAEIEGITDHRAMLILHDAARFAQLQAQKQPAVKRVRATPQQANPGARITRDPKQVASQQAKERFTKSRGRDQDAAAAYFEHLAH